MKHGYPGAFLAAVIMVTGCSSDGDSGGDVAAQTGARGSADNGGAAGPGENGEDAGDDSSPDFGNPDPSDASGEPADGDTGGASDEPADADNCAQSTQGAMRIDVDMYIMLDRSSSMLAETGAGATKWDAIRDALTAFVEDPQSDGLGVGLQYFPLGIDGVPESCVSDAECGARGGPCGNRACLPDPSAETFELIPCLDVSQCPVTSPGCVPFGVCEADDTLACTDFAGGCGPQGACQPLEGGCLAFASCDPVDYATPAVAIEVLPENGSDVVASLTMANPTGLTPTGAALVGALDQARAHALGNPDHRVLAVLATDGLPTDCVPPGVMTLDEAVDAVATEATLGVTEEPTIPTYVIGVFSPEEPEAMQKLDQIALAGGTESAFIVDASADVGQQFLAALSQIRGGSLACEFLLPTPPAGEELDPMKVNVELTDAGGTRGFAFVGGPDGCGQAELEWFYAEGPDGETTIQVCEDTCDALKAQREASVQIVLGCKTKGPQ